MSYKIFEIFRIFIFIIGFDACVWVHPHILYEPVCGQVGIPLLILDSGLTQRKFLINLCFLIINSSIFKGPYLPSGWRHDFANDAQGLASLRATRRGSAGLINLSYRLVGNFITFCLFLN